MRVGRTSRSGRVALVGLALATVLAVTIDSPADGQPSPAPSPSASPAPPPPPPPPQPGTRVVATTVTADGQDLDVRVMVYESDVAGVDGGWRVTLAAEAGVPGTITSEAVTITGDGGVPASTADTGDDQRAATLFTVTGQQAGATYGARYLAFGRASFPAERRGRPLVTVTLIQ